MPTDTPSEPLDPFEEPPSPPPPSLASMKLEAGATSRSATASASTFSLRWRARLAGLSLLAYVPLLLMMGWVTDTIIETRPDFSPEQRALANLVGYTLLTVFLIGALAVSLWVWRASKILRRLGAVTPAYSAPLAVASFYIPVWNLWRPYVVVRAIWQASINPNDWDNVAVSQVLPLWWLAWLGHAGSLLVGMALEPIVIGEHRQFMESIVLILFVGSGVVGALCLLSIIRRTTHRLIHQLNARRTVN